MSFHRRFGLTTLVVGALTAIVSLCFGFYFLITDHDELAKGFLPLVPVGFLIAFTGLVAIVLSEPRQHGHR